MLKTVVIAAIAAIWSNSAIAQHVVQPITPTTITFDELNPGPLGYDYYPGGTTLETQNLRFQTFSVNDDTLFALAPTQGGDDPKGIALGVQASAVSSHGLDIYATGSGPGTPFPTGAFNVGSFQLAGWGNTESSNTVDISYFVGSQWVTYTLTLDDSGFQTLTPNLVDVRAVHIIPTSSNVGFQIDNFTFAPTLPEPSTWAMMLLGFFGIGVAFRCNRLQSPHYV